MKCRRLRWIYEMTSGHPCAGRVMKQKSRRDWEISAGIVTVSMVAGIFYCANNFHFWLDPPLEFSWSIWVEVDVLPAGSPSTRLLCRLKSV